MKRLIEILGFICFCALFWVATPTTASEPVGVMRFTEGANSITLFDKACENGGVLARIAPENRHMFRTGQSVLDGKTYDMCWAVPVEQPVVFLVYDDGDVGRLPLAAFQRAQGV
jgi:hypothetical protein